MKQHAVGEPPRGVYFEGTAQLLKDVDENHVAYKLYCERFHTGKTIVEELNHEDGHQFYKITVNTFYVFDAIEKPSNKYELPWKK